MAAEQFQSAQPQARGEPKDWLALAAPHSSGGAKRLLGSVSTTPGATLYLQGSHASRVITELLC